MKSNSTYKLLNIFLIESYFKRENFIHFEDDDFQSKVDFEIEDNTEENNLNIILTLHFNAGKTDNKEITSTIKMLGIFELTGESTSIISSEDFAKINGPAIIFPFIREHLANVTMKAGLNPILLPPINFVKLAKEKWLPIDGPTKPRVQVQKQVNFISDQKSTTRVGLNF